MDTSWIDHTLREGGCTFAVDGRIVKHSTGFMVGGVVTPSHPVPMQRSEIWQAFLQFADANWQHVGGRFWGTWRDDSGQCVLDVAEHVEVREDALRMAAERGEDAIWDCKRARAIRVA